MRRGGGERRDRGDVEEELRHHLELMIEENVERGMSLESARREALRQFGDVRRIRLECEEEDRMAEVRAGRHEWLAGWLEDVRYGLRLLVRSPLYALVIVVTLGFGMGSIAAVFSVLSPYFLRPLPFADAKELVHVFTVDPVSGWDKDRFSLPQIADLTERTHGLVGVAAYYYSAANVSGDDAAEQVTVGRLTSNAFDVLGTRAAVGRTFEEDDVRAGTSDVIVLSWGLWQRRYAGDPGVVGRETRVDGLARTIIGVMPKDFNFPFGGVKAWIPATEEATTEPRDRDTFLMFGRLRPDWTAGRVRADLDAAWHQLSDEYPQIDGRKSGINVLAMRPALNFAWDILRVAFSALTGAVIFVLLIACANITGLGLARAADRRREVAVRSALGAPRRRLVRQFLVESALLSTLGATFGLVLAHLFVRGIAPVIPEDLYAVGEFRVDALAVAVTGAITMLTAALIGTAPALSVTGVSPGDVLRDSGRSGSAGRRTSRLRRFLVTTELALGLVLAAGAGLMVRSLREVSNVPLGFQPDPVLTVELSVPSTMYGDAAAVASYYDRVTDAALAVPGVAAAGTAAWLPLNHEVLGVRYDLPGSTVAAEDRPLAERFYVSPGYLDAMQIALRAGREFTSADAGGEPVALINRTLAERDFDGNGVGSTFLIGEKDPVSYRVVGIVDDVQHSSIVSPPPPQIYLPVTDATVRRRFLVVRGQRDPAALGSSIRQAVTSIDDNVPANRVRPMNSIVDESVGPFAAMSMVLGVFGSFALLLAAVGLYGLIAYTVSRRRAEFGVRMALGAGPGDVLRGVLVEGTRLALVGIAIGLVAAVAAGRVLTSLVFGVSTGDPLTLGAAVLIFTTAALLATSVPARRASRSDPLAALRSE